MGGSNEIVLFETEDRNVTLSVKVEDETVWFELYNYYSTNEKWKEYE